MKEAGIMFTAENVRAILEGRKTETRRTAKLPTDFKDKFNHAYRLPPELWEPTTIGGPGCYLDKAMTKQAPETGALWNPKGATCISYSAGPGDRLWVKETWFNTNPGQTTRDFVRYMASPDPDKSVLGCHDVKWGSAMFMPRWASRITLEIINVRAERVQDITAAGCIAEGIQSRGIDRGGPCIAAALMYIEDYKTLWNSINKKKNTWQDNPWVWVIQFRRLQ